MREIGGYFALEELIGKEYHENCICVNSGRNALLYILKSMKVKRLYLPFFLCDSVKDMCKKYKYKTQYYAIDNNLYPIIDWNLGDDEYLYIVNYYGQLTEEKIILLKDKFNNVILDNTQAFFQKPIGEIPTIYSCRKFFGVPDGAYLYTDVRIREALPHDVSRIRMKHLLGRYEETAQGFYSDFKENEDSFEQEPLKYMSALTHNFLKGIDYASVRKKREENFLELDSALGDSNKLLWIMPEGPFAYPYYTDDGIRIRRILQEKKIYIPTLWPNVLEDMPEDSFEYQCSANILPLPCDQRYSNKDMEYIIEELKNCEG